MINNLICVSMSELTFDTNALKKFDCGNVDFNEFLEKDALNSAMNGDGVTYVVIPLDEYEQGVIYTILAFATFSAMALLYEQNHQIMGIPALEIKYFAISKRLHKGEAYIKPYYKYYSTILFEHILAQIYQLSWKNIGFRTIFLRANKQGEKLYRRKSFTDAEGFLIPYSDDDPLGQCVPLMLPIQENLYSIFGCE